eukprot:scaffold9857_cov127-Cylindrotheca_fusiformis.AAC.2
MNVQSVTFVEEYSRCTRKQGSVLYRSGIAIYPFRLPSCDTEIQHVHNIVSDLSKVRPSSLMDGGRIYSARFSTGATL